MNDYYTALRPEPVLFGMGMRATSVPADRPDYVAVPVTPAMTAAALNYLGDCLFYGRGLPEDRAAAASCYREAADMKITIPRGQSDPPGRVWAQYSYGWCLLHGVGVSFVTSHRLSAGAASSAKSPIFSFMARIRAHASSILSSEITPSRTARATGSPSFRKC